MFQLKAELYPALRKSISYFF